MRKRLFVYFFFGVAANAAAPRPCGSLSTLNLPNTSIAIAQSVPAGSFTPPGGKPISGLPAFCRVAGVIKPTADSRIEFEVWMPAAGWNKKFQGIGNGGFAGYISYGMGGLSTAITHGYAAVSTDTGHKASGVDAAWALGHPEKIVDFGHRAIHEMTVKGKAITEAFYGEAPRRSYFASCSNGGRQALMEAQRYPADYDGIVSGAPANYWTALLAGFLWNTRALSAPGAAIPPEKLPALEAGVLAACDANDGIKDGVVDDPSRCRFDPATLLCKQGDAPDCLTAPQAEALKKVYTGPRDSNGAPIVAGFSPGAETGNGGWAPWITGTPNSKSLQYMFSTQFLGNMVYQQKDWDTSKFDFDRDVKMVNEKFGPILNATDPNLKAFKDRGGKLIIYHGWNDPALPPRNTIHYYNTVRDTMGAKTVESFVRLYLMPGVQHCAGGPGPNFCGGLGPALTDPGHDFSAAVERWVEQGKAPATMVARKYAKPFDLTSQVERTRPLCPYPAIATYTGSGSVEDPANFRCKVP